MLISRVTYTVKTEFVEQNKANVRAVMDAVRAGDNPGVAPPDGWTPTRA